MYAHKHGWWIAKHFPILLPFYSSFKPIGCSGPLSRALPVLQHWHAESIPALQATSSSSIPSSHATCVTLDELTPKQQKRKHKKWRKSTARSYKEEPWLQLDRRGDKVFTWITIQVWRDNFPISKKRNSTEWDAIAKKLNSTFKDQGIPCYCTGTQCKVCIKYLQDQYKWVKDHNSQSGNNWEWFEYYDEIYEVLGSKPNITPKDVKCGLAEDANTTTVGDSDT